MSRQFFIYSYQNDDGTIIPMAESFLRVFLESNHLTEANLLQAGGESVRRDEVTLWPDLTFGRERRVHAAISRMNPGTGLMQPDETLRPGATIEHYVKAWSFVQTDEDGGVVVDDNGKPVLVPVSAVGFDMLPVAVAEIVYMEVCNRIRPTVTGIDADFFTRLGIGTAAPETATTATP